MTYADRVSQMLSIADRCTDSSEHRHLIEFLEMCLSNYAHDGTTSKKAVQASLLSSIDELVESAEHFRQAIKGMR